MLFDSYEITKEEGHVRLYAEMLIQYENAYNESFQRGTPKWWDDYILQIIDVEEYDIYFICSCTLPKGRYSRVTDYKKIWGLNELEHGIYDNSYVNDVGKVYFGIIKTQGEKIFRSNVASTVWLVKRGSEVIVNKVFETFQKFQYDFRNVINSEGLMYQYICGMNKDSILLRYNCMREISLNIYGENIEQLFAEFDVAKYNGCDVDVVYRKT